MRKPNIDDRVKLVDDMEELGLHRGDVGVVKSTWFVPTTAYEVEFKGSVQTKVLVLAEQIQVESEEPTAP